MSKPDEIIILREFEVKKLLAGHLVDIIRPNLHIRLEVGNLFRQIGD